MASSKVGCSPRFTVKGIRYNFSENKPDEEKGVDVTFHLQDRCDTRVLTVVEGGVLGFEGFTLQNNWGGLVKTGFTAHGGDPGYRDKLHIPGSEMRLLFEALDLDYKRFMHRCAACRKVLKDVWPFSNDCSILYVPSASAGMIGDDLMNAIDDANALVCPPCGDDFYEWRTERLRASTVPPLRGGYADLAPPPVDSEYDRWLTVEEEAGLWLSRKTK
ncbi:MAG: hypothetical protein DRQ40_05350 [Gammaproteobacteria bacterium]|nr:MAG: hypothetical protein DRQ40_05350 [Gammaproteobacteria bacterium]